ncbi:MAG: hypothetical protein ABIH52_00955 [Candidatus Aenigmatarchaeota archaeon]
MKNFIIFAYIHARLKRLLILRDLWLVMIVVKKLKLNHVNYTTHILQKSVWTVA